VGHARRRYAWAGLGFGERLDLPVPLICSPEDSPSDGGTTSCEREDVGRKVSQSHPLRPCKANPLRNSPPSPEGTEKTK